MTDREIHQHRILNFNRQIKRLQEKWPGVYGNKDNVHALMTWVIDMSADWFSEAVTKFMLEGSAPIVKFRVLADAERVRLKRAQAKTNSRQDVVAKDEKQPVPGVPKTPVRPSTHQKRRRGRPRRPTKSAAAVQKTP